MRPLRPTILRPAGAGELLSLAGISTSTRELHTRLVGGEALSKFREMVKAQHGDLALMTLPDWTPVTARADGFVESIHCDQLGSLVMEMGAGRHIHEDTIDHGVGVRLDVKVGDEIKKDDIIGAVVHSKADEYVERIANMIDISNAPTAPLPLIIEVVT